MTRYTYPSVLTKYYFDVFIVSPHHSMPRLIADLMVRKKFAEEQIESSTSNAEKEILSSLIKLINEKLKTLDLDELADIEHAEPVYWINELSRRCAIEINSYGRVRPETMELLMCVEDDDFVKIMSTANRITLRIQQLDAFARHDATPKPDNMPSI
jgi:hypothetical protein